MKVCEVVGDNEVTPDGYLVHFGLIVGVEPINYSEDLKDKKWKAAGRRVTSD